MGLNASKMGNKGNSKPQEPIEPDVYAARVVQVIDLGLQAQKPYQGKEKTPTNEIYLTYELTTEFMKDEDGEDIEDKPRWISESLPFYGLFADKAKSTKRYEAFDPTNEFGGDFAQCVNVPVNVTIVNNVVGDKVYNNIANVAAMSAKKAATVAKLKNPTKVFDLDNPDMEVFNSLPEWLRDKIKGNLNFQGSPLQAKLGNAGKAQPGPARAVEKQAAAGSKTGDDEAQSNSPW
jgi:hypothetical protein